jgi:Na+/H+-dicarboxylate symporter
MKILRWYLNSNLLLRIMLGLILGAVCGIIVGEPISLVQPLGDIFVRSLKMIVMPVVMSTLVVGAASVHPKNLGKVGGKALLVYMVTTVIAVVIGLVYGNLLKPGFGMELPASAADAVANPAAAPSLIETIMNIVPTNPFAAFSTGNMLPTIFFCILFGIAISHLKESDDPRKSRAAQTIYDVFDGAAEVMYMIVNWILQYAPIGVFALIAVVSAKQGPEALGPLGLTTLSIYLAMLTHIFLTYGLMLMIFGINPWKFFQKAKPAMLTAFVTRSSGGTLPVSMEVAELDMGIAKGVYSFSLPLGATINMDGTAIYQGVCVLFISFAIGGDLTLTQQLTVITTALLASIGTAGVPGAGVIMLMLVLNSIGMKVEPGTKTALAYAMILGIDAILDMGRTATNVTGDLAVTCAVAKSEKQMDLSKWE